VLLQELQRAGSHGSQTGDTDFQRLTQLATFPGLKVSSNAPALRMKALMFLIA
jgi:hypothetical protein